MKKKFTHVEELKAQFRMSLQFIQGPHRKEKTPVQWSLYSLVISPGYI